MTSHRNATGEHQTDVLLANIPNGIGVTASYAVTLMSPVWPMRCAVGGLGHHRGVPPRVQVDHVVGPSEVQSEPPL